MSDSKEEARIKKAMSDAFDAAGLGWALSTPEAQAFGRELERRLITTPVTTPAKRPWPAGQAGKYLATEFTYILGICERVWSERTAQDLCAALHEVLHPEVSVGALKAATDALNTVDDESVAGHDYTNAEIASLVVKAAFAAQFGK